MSVAELEKTKSALIAWIGQLSDADMLTFLNNIRTSKSETEWWNELTPEQQQQVDKGLNDLKNNNVLSSDNFWSRLKNG